MISLAKKYLHENNVLHNVLSFPFVEGKDGFVEPPDNIIHLGEIVICYPKTVEEASAEGRLIDEKVIELTVHGALHLLGKHHE
jgi:probable rRNA maturation factor